ncbi:MAG: sensor histidine kinase, partial [Rubricoccaceae bacterium]|nr:sensor histidine kinase [Rubricoccaceae bacterium]
DLGRAVNVLLANAVEALEERAQQEASLNGKSTYTPTLTVCTERNDSGVVISVTDNGSGIAEKDRDRIFEPFFSTKPAGSGHPGLGLSLAHDTIVNGYNGEVTLQPTDRERTSFCIMLAASE